MQKKWNFDPSSKIRLQDFSEITGGNVEMKGDLKLSGKMAITGNKIKDSQFTLQSNNITLPVQTIKSFNIPLIPLGKFMFKAKMNRRGLLTIQTFQAGGNESPILLEVEGTMKVNQRYMQKIENNLESLFQILVQFKKR